MRAAARPEHVTPEQAKYVLDRLVADQRVSPAEITRILKEMHREIAELEERLDFLRRLGEGRRTGRRAQRRSPAAAASLKLQGKYLNLIRQIPPRKRGTYRRIATTEGREAAIKAMQAALD